MIKYLLFFYLFSIGIIQCIYAQSKITIYHETGERFWVVIDGKKVNERPSERVDIENIETTFIKVLVIFENEKIKNLDRTIATRDPDGRYTYSKYIIRQKGSKAQIRLYSMEPIDYTPAPVVQQALPLQQSSQPAVQQPDQQSTQPDVNTNIQIIDPVTGQPVDVSVQVQLPPLMPPPTQQPTLDIQTGNPPQHHQTQNQSAVPSSGQQPTYQTHSGCQIPMNDNDFQQAKATIASKNFEDTKLSIAKQIIISQCLLSSQVRQIMQIFNFESTRLEFAKFAYEYVYDPGNYFQVNDAFQFESSVEELNRYISARPRR